MATISVNELFQSIKPVCVTITKNPSKENLTSALNYFKKLERSSVKDAALLEYATFPFKLTLKRGKLSEEQEILVFQCLENLLQKADESTITEDVLLWGFNTFSVYFTTKEMFVRNNEAKETLKKAIDKSEEQKLVLVKFISSLLQNTPDQILLRTYNETNLPLVGHIVAVLINLTEKERNTTLQVFAIRCLKLLTGCNLDYKSHRIAIGNYFACFFPGITLSFNNLLTSGENHSSKVAAAWLDTFQFVVFIVLSDPDTKRKLTDREDILHIAEKKLYRKQKEDNYEGEEKKIKVVCDEIWIKQTAEHMETVFNNVLPILMTHKNVNIRKALLEFLDIVLTHCMDTLMRCVSGFLDVIAKLTSDAYKEIRERSEAVLESARLRFHENENQDLHVILQERLQSHVLSLPRIMNGSSDEVKLAHLHIIKGYLMFFGKHFQEYLFSLSHLEMFFSALLQVLELQTKNIRIVEERTNVTRQAIQINSSTRHEQYYHRDFRYFNSSDVLAAFKDIIRLVAENGDIDLVIDHLLTSTIENPRIRLQTVFVLNEVLRCCKDRNDVDISLYVDQVIETYLQDCFWKSPVTNDHLRYFDKRNDYMSEDLFLVQKRESFCQVVPFEVLNSNIQLICLLLEGMAIHALVLRTNYNTCLMKTLYPILEKIGCVNAAVSHTASQVLMDISEFTNYESVGDLLLINSDYLINAITLQFRHLVYGTAAPCVLAVILKLCNSDIMSIICDTIEDVFQALDEYQEEVAEEMLNVLKYFAIAVDKWYNSATDTTKCSKEKHETTDVSNSYISLQDFTIEYLKLSASATGDVEENEHTSEMDYKETLPEEDTQDAQETKQEIPQHYQIVITCLKKCDYYVAAHEQSVKLKALDVVYHGIIALREQENDLLPALHKVWPTVIQRLKETDLVIVLKALDVVCCMVTHSGDFLRKRLSTEFIPFAINFLKTRQGSFTKSKSQYTQVHRVINKLISFLSDVLQHLDISTKQFCEVATACLPYLNCVLHETVKSTAVEAMVKLYQVQPDVIWLLLSTTSPVNEFASPHKYFPKFVVSEAATERNIYSDNVSIIFKKINIE